MSIVGSGGIEIMRPGEEAREITPFVRKFRWVESMIDGGWVWSIQVTAPFWREWADLILGQEEIKLRLKSQDAGRDTTTDWRTAYVNDSGVAFRSTSLAIEVRGTDKRLELRQRDRTRAWLGRTVSSIVREIGQEYGYDVVATSTEHESDRWQLRETDWDFMQRLVLGSAGGGGRGDLFLWQQDDRTLRLGVPEPRGRSDRRHILAEAENRVDRVTVRYNGRNVDRAGGATLTGVAYDVEHRETMIYTLDAGETEPYTALARQVPRTQANGLRILLAGEGGIRSVREQTHSVWGRLAPRYFTLRVDSRPDMALKPGMLMEVEGNVGTNQETPLLGRYVVLEVHHQYEQGEPDRRDKGGLVTTAVCYRREAALGQEDPQGASAASGGTRDRTRGAGPANPGRTVLVAEVLP